MNTNKALAVIAAFTIAAAPYAHAQTATKAAGASGAQAAAVGTVSVGAVAAAVLVVAAASGGGGSASASSVPAVADLTTAAVAAAATVADDAVAVIAAVSATGDADVTTAANELTAANNELTTARAEATTAADNLSYATTLLAVTRNGTVICAAASSCTQAEVSELTGIAASKSRVAAEKAITVVNKMMALKTVLTTKGFTALAETVEAKITTSNTAALAAKKAANDSIEIYNASVGPTGSTLNASTATPGTTAGTGT